MEEWKNGRMEAFQCTTHNLDTPTAQHSGWLCLMRVHVCVMEAQRLYANRQRNRQSTAEILQRITFGCTTPVTHRLPVRRGHSARLVAPAVHWFVRVHVVREVILVRTTNTQHSATEVSCCFNKNCITKVKPIL